MLQDSTSLGSVLLSEPLRRLARTPESYICLYLCPDPLTLPKVIKCGLRTNFTKVNPLMWSDTPTLRLSFRLPLSVATQLALNLETLGHCSVSSVSVPASAGPSWPVQPATPTAPTQVPMAHKAPKGIFVSLSLTSNLGC